MRHTSIGIIGVGGFAATHIAAARRCAERGLGRLAAVVSRLPYIPGSGEAEREEELRQSGVRIYRSYQEMLRSERGQIDLVTVPLGIALHAPVSISALEEGFHVLCEKPAAGSNAEAENMRSAREASGRILAIGYQYLLTDGIQSLKAAALDGRYGRLIEARTIVRWPRDSHYYGRNEWAGKLTVEGRPVRDSPMQNAASHFLQNMLYVAGPSPDSAAQPTEIYAENYRANEIESADTQFVRIRTETGVSIIFVASHAIGHNVDPYSEFRFERATVAWDPEGGARLLAAKLNDPASGQRIVPPQPLPYLAGFETHDLPFVDTLHAIAEGGRPMSSIENALPHTVCVESAFASSQGVHTIPTELCAVTERPVGGQSDGAQLPATLIVVDGLEELLSRSFATGLGPSELGVPWAKPGKVIRPTTD